MRIEFLGTGTSTGNPQLLCKCPTCLSKDPHDIRLRSSIYISDGKTSVLVDCGPDFRQQALRSDIKRIDGVILTHEHYDHCGGIDDLRPFCYLKGKMDLYSYPRVFRAIKRNMPYAFKEPFYPNVPHFNVNPVRKKKFTIGSMNFLPLELMHYKLKVLGFRCGDFAYMTDFNSIEEKELKKIEGVKVMVVDALREKKHISHNSLSQALAIIDRVKPEKAYLIHMSHDMGLHREVNSKLPENVSLSYDGLIIDL